LELDVMDILDKAQASDCYKADTCVMAGNCPFLNDCEAVEHEGRLVSDYLDR
jgi:hypothetical protein